MSVKEPFLLSQMLSRLGTTDRLREALRRLPLAQEAVRTAEQLPATDTKVLENLRDDVSRLQALVQELSATVKALVGHTEGGEKSKEWTPFTRGVLVETACGKTPWHRVGLVCDAGLGKTTNMAWLHTNLSDNRFGARVPFLIRLDDGDHFDLMMSTHRKVADEAFLDWLAERVCTAPGNQSADKRRVKLALERLRKDGRVTLLFDGLDHALSDPRFPAAMEGLMKSAQWQACPMWLAGRPYAFKDADVWKRLFADNLPDWTFLQVEPFDEPTVKRYMALTTGQKWYAEFPSKPILQVPRLLKLVCGVVNTEMARSESADPKDFLAKLRTPADVYHQAYFGYGPAEYGNMGAQGLLYQGIENSRDANVAKIGLYDGRTPSAENIEERIRRAGELLGAIAFHLFDLHGDKDKPEPETGSVSRDVIKAKLLERLMAAGWGGAKEYEDDITRLETMNARHLEFLLFRELNQRLFRFHDRTVQAFFAAVWASRFPVDRERVKRWGILPASDEFWQFALDLPDPLITEERWQDMVRVIYMPPPLLNGTDEYVQWTRRKIHDTFSAVLRRSPSIIETWRAPAEVRARVQAGLVRIPGDERSRLGDPLTEHRISTFTLHMHCVTNFEYEAFDPNHRIRRWESGEPHPVVVKSGAGADDRCPAVNVTFWDAWCYAAWVGCRLPTEWEWEHACRAGSTWTFYFGDQEAELPRHAWFDGNSESMTHPVGGKPDGGAKHPHGLFDILGNVWEWCESLYTPRGPFRVFRGGCWDFSAWICRSAFRNGFTPVICCHNLGFRLAADDKPK